MSSSTKVLLLTLIITGTITLGACQQPKQANVSPAQPTEISQQTNQTKAETNQKAEITPDDWLVVNEERIIPVVDQLGQQLSQARQNYLKGDNAAASMEMKEGAKFLKQEIPQATKEDIAALNKASDELMKQSSLVENGEIKSVKELDQVFAEAYRADIEHLWLYVDKQEWIPIIESPQKHWQEAQKDFLKQDNQTAGIEVRKGAAFLNLEANRTTDAQIKSNLLNSVKNLEQLAKEIQAGKIADVTKLDRAFAQGQLAMGQFFENKAQASEAQGELVKAGHEIIGAFHHLQAANSWLGEDKANLEMAQTEIKAVKDSMSSPNEAQSKNLSKAIATVGEQIQLLTQKL
jgi:hypothetical protein